MKSIFVRNFVILIAVAILAKFSIGNVAYPIIYTKDVSIVKTSGNGVSEQEKLVNNLDELVQDADFYPVTNRVVRNRDKMRISSQLQDGFCLSASTIFQTNSLISKVEEIKESENNSTDLMSLQSNAETELNNDINTSSINGEGYNSYIQQKNNSLVNSLGDVSISHA